MARSNARARDAAKARSEYARRPPEGTTPVGMPPAAPFFVVGGALAALAFAVLGWFALVSYRGGSLDGLVSTLAPDFPPIALPIGIFMFAGCALFLAEMFRRATWFERTKWKLTRGTATFRIRVLSLRARLLWMLVPAALYVALIPLPVVLAGRSTRPSDDFWLLVTAHGFLAAGFVGVFATSLVKRSSYRRSAVPSASGAQRTFWRVASVQWRIESWFGFLAASLAGVLPLAVVRSGGGPVAPDAVPVLATIAVGSGIVALLAALAAPRSGTVEGEAESVG